MKNLHSYLIAFGIFIVTGMVVMFSGCGKAATGQSSNVSMSMGTFTAKNSIFDFLIPSAYAALSNGKMCFKRLRFKKDGEDTTPDPAVDPENIEFEPGEITITTSGTNLGAVSVPGGTYSRIEIDLEKDGKGCTSGKSVEFTNSNGTFSSTDSISIKFRGSFTASKPDELIALSVQNIVNAMNGVGPASVIKKDLEAANGNF